MFLCLWGFSRQVGYWSGLPCPPPGKFCCTNKQFLEYRGLSTIKYSWRAHTKPSVHQDPGKGAVALQETDPDLPVSVQVSPAEAWVSVACCRVGGTECRSVCMGLFEGGHHYLHYLHHSLAPGKY